MLLARRLTTLLLAASRTRRPPIMWADAGANNASQHDIYGFEEVVLPPLPSGETLFLAEMETLASNNLEGDDGVATEGSSDIWRKIERYVAECDEATDEAGVGGELWPAAGALCAWMANHTDIICGARVLELGAGTGACGIYAAALGASRVLLTDGGSQALLDLCARNVDANGGLWAQHGTRVDVAPLTWGTGSAPAENFDLVIASDCTYGHEEFGIESKVIGSLTQTLGALLRRGASGATASEERATRRPRVLLAHEHRSRDRGLPWLREDLASWDDGDEHLESLHAASRAEGLCLTPLWTERPRCIERGEFRSWTADLSIVEVTLESQSG